MQLERPTLDKYIGHPTQPDEGWERAFSPQYCTFKNNLLMWSDFRTIFLSAILFDM